MTNKICPLFLAAVKSGNFNHDSDCIEERCAWWNKFYGDCAILEVARSLNKMEERGRV